MSLAEKRLNDLLERWQASLDRHARYLKLDAAAYARAEAWPKHQRPSAWVVDLARKRLQDLRALSDQRAAARDDQFAEALELMSFLTSLLGSEHIERFIPLATGKPPDTAVSATVEQPRLRGAAKSNGGRSGPAPAASASGRHAMPRPQATTSRRAASPLASSSGSSTRIAPNRTAATSTANRTAAAPAASLRPPAANPTRAATASPAPAPPKDAVSRQVIADAVRMLEWGKEWPALAGLIARMADRPSESGVWKILRAHRNEILTRARRPAP
jgi:hypothetical protein